MMRQLVTAQPSVQDIQDLFPVISHLGLDFFHFCIALVSFARPHIARNISDLS